MQIYLAVDFFDIILIEFIDKIKEGAYTLPAPVEISVIQKCLNLTKSILWG